MFFRGFVMLFAVVLASCMSTNPATGAKNFTLMGEQQEFAMGQEVAEKAIKLEGEYTADPALTAYYQDIAERLVKVGERADKSFEFLLLDSPTFNAWAVPGYINMYRGILPFFNNEAEFVSVMAHEMGHVTARHSAQQVTKGTLANILVTGVAIYAGTQIDNAATANALYAAGAFGATVTLKGYSRMMEAEADRLALRYMGKLGYDARESYNMFATMGRYHDLIAAEYAYFNDGKSLPKTPFYNILLSHPEPETRMAQVAQLAGQPDGTLRTSPGVTPATSFSDPQGQQRFYKMIDALPFGPQKKFGIAGNGVLYHPELRFKWALPEGYTFSEVKEQDGDDIISSWKAYNASDKTMAFQRVEKLVTRGTGKDLLNKTYPNISDIVGVKLNGTDGYMGKVTVLEKLENWPAGTYRVLAIPAPDKRVGDTGHTFIVLALGVKKGADFTGQDAGFKQSLAQTRLLSSTEAARLKPLEIDIQTVRAGESVATYASKMAMGGLREEWFRTLNGLDKNSTLKAGQLVKVVIDPNNNS